MGLRVEVVDELCVSTDCLHLVQGDKDASSYNSEVCYFEDQPHLDPPLRGEEYKLCMKLFLALVITIVSAAIIAGLFVVGTPKSERVRRFDDMRIQHLQQIQSDLIYYWQSSTTLPLSFDELRHDKLGLSVPVDPQTGEPYEYVKRGATEFMLCATFGADSAVSDYAKGSARDFMPVPVPVPPGGSPGVPIYLSPIKEKETWEHAAGRVCFDRTIEPEYFKPLPKQ